MSNYRIVLIPTLLLLPAHIVTNGESRHIEYRQAVRSSSKTVPPLKVTSFVSPISSFMHIERLIYFFVTRVFHCKSCCSHFGCSYHFLYNTKVTLRRPNPNVSGKFIAEQMISASAGPIPAS